eukprot:7482797-Alexandrium_andersonii.AAC.1
MSASLVGSEMCIRDRVATGEGVGADEKAEQRRTSEKTAGEHARGRTSVSYTHLTLPTICSV